MTDWTALQGTDLNSNENDDQPFLTRASRIPVERTSNIDKQLTLEDLSTDQKHALGAILQNESDFITFGGLAGSGKSTLIPFIAQGLHASMPAFCAYTGKAANVLDRKLQATNNHHFTVASTIHSLIYRPRTDREGNITGWDRNDELDHDLIIVDESSMVGQKIFDDLRSFNVPIIAVGDPGQLPPIEDDSVILYPHVSLTQIHRQAANNPIIQLAHEIRRSGDIPKNFPESEHVRFCSQRDVFDIIEEADKRLGLNFGILVRRNAMRRQFNMAPRLTKEPQLDDIVICLKNSPPIYNGMRGILDSIRPHRKHWYHASIRFPDDGLVITGKINRHQFGREYTLKSTRDAKMPPNEPLGLLFDFGTAMTVHKAQGSAFDEVVLFPERWTRDDQKDYERWLYTAVTRASNKITIVRK